MGGLEDILARLVNDPGFREQLATDPAGAVVGYDLSDADLEVLAASLDGGTGGEHSVETRTSKSAMLGVLGSLAGTSTDAGSIGTSPGADDDGQYHIAQVTHDADRGSGVKGSSFAMGTGDEPAVGDPDAPIVLGRLPNGADGQGAELGSSPEADGLELAGEATEEEAPPYGASLEEHVGEPNSEGPVPTPYPSASEAAEPPDPADGSGRAKPQFHWDRSEGTGASG